jgi:hypothetical protein
MSQTERVVIQLQVAADGALQTLHKFDSAMTASANASVKAGAGLDALHAQLARQRAAMESGLPVLKARAAALSLEEKTLQSVFGRADPIARARIAAERDLGKAAAAASNLVVQGRLSEEEAIRQVMAIEAAHANQIQAAILNAHQLAAANDVVAASNLRVASTANRAATRQNLIYQGQDIAVQLAGGQNPALIAMQQLPQILSGPGGANAALKETGNLAMLAVTRFGPLAAVVGAGSVAIAGMRDEIEKSSGVAVTFGDVALATWQVISGGIYQLIKPAVDAIGGWFAAAWDWAVQATRTAGNWIIREVLGAFEIIKATVLSIPDAFIAAGQGAANGFLAGIEKMVRNAMEQLNSLFDGLNGLTAQLGWEPIKLFDPESVDFGEIEVGGTAALARLDAGWKELGGTLDGIAQEDYLGTFFGDVQQQSIANATERLAENEEATKGAGKAAKDAAKESDAYADTLKKQQEAAEELASSIEQALGGAIQSLFDGPITSLDDALDRILSSFSQLGNANLSKLTEGLFGSNTSQATGGQHGAGFWGDAIFALPGAVRDGAKEGSATGLFAGIKGLQGAGPMLSAGIGGLGIGYQAQDPLMGGLGGAAAGAMAGMAGGPAGMAVGAAIGKLSGLIKPAPTSETSKETPNDGDQYRIAA